MVKVPGPLTGGVTNEQGNFEIRNVPVGKYDIAVSYIGYQSKLIPNVVVTSGKEVVLSIEIMESITELEGVVITSNEQTGEVLNEFSTVSSLSFSMEEASKYAGTFNDPARMVTTTAGVIGGGGSDDVENEIIIRGNSPRGLLWRIEGVEVPSPNHFTDQGASSGSVSIISSNMMSTSDFFTSAFPAEYGNALSGVFDIKIRNGNSEKREYAFSLGLIGVDAAMEGPFKKGGGSSYLMNYRYSTLSVLNDIGIELVDDALPIFQDLSFKVNFPTKKLGTFSLFGIGGLSKETEVTKGRLNSGEDGDLLTETFTSDLGVVGLNHDIMLSDKTRLLSVLSLSANEVTFTRDVALSRSNSIRVNNEDFVDYSSRLSVALNHKFNAQHLFKGGFIFSYLNYDLLSQVYSNSERMLVDEVNNEGNTSVVQGYATWKYRLSGNFVLNSGLHFTQFMLNNHRSIEPRLNAKWFLDDKQSLSFGFGLHSRREGLATYLVEMSPQSDVPPVALNKDLDLSKALHYVLGYNYFFTDNLSFKAEAYYQDLYDVPVIDNSYYSVINAKKGFTGFELVNEGTGTNYGVELTLQSFFNQNYYFNTNVSLFQSKYVGGDGIERNTLYNSNFVANVLGGYDFELTKNRSLNLNLRTVYAGGQRYTPINEEQSRQQGMPVYDLTRIYEEQLENYFRADFQASYTLNYPKHTLTFKLEIQNITDRANVREIVYSPVLRSVDVRRRGQILPIASVQVKF